MSSLKRARGLAAWRPENESEWLDVPEVEMFGGPRRAATKTIQLCRQVEEAISCALLCSASPILRDLYVIGVEAARGAALLRVLVTTEGDAHGYQQTSLWARRRCAVTFENGVARGKKCLCHLCIGLAMRLRPTSLKSRWS